MSLISPVAANSICYCSCRSSTAQRSLYSHVSLLSFASLFLNHEQLNYSTECTSAGCAHSGFSSAFESIACQHKCIAIQSNVLANVMRTDSGLWQGKC